MVAVRRLLFVEDAHLLATVTVGEFAQLGVAAVGPAGSVKQALELARIMHDGVRFGTPDGGRMSSARRVWAV